MTIPEPPSIADKYGVYLLAGGLLVVVAILSGLMISMFTHKPAPQITEIQETPVSIAMVSGTEYAPNQPGQVIVEARYPNGTTAIQRVNKTLCTQPNFNTTSSCGFNSTEFYTYTVGSEFLYVEFNITKAINATGLNFTYKVGEPEATTAKAAGPVKSKIIDQDCWDYDNDSVVMQVEFRGGATIYDVKISCHNSTGWFSFESGGNNTVGGLIGGTAGTVSDIQKMFDQNFNTDLCYFGFGTYKTQCFSGGGGRDLGSSFYDQNYTWIYQTSNCEASIWYPDKTPVISNYSMDLSDSNGNAFTTFNVPNIDGVYEYQSNCAVGNKTYIASKSFHVTKKRIGASITK
jgi:hypothetical protein